MGHITWPSSNDMGNLFCNDYHQNQSNLAIFDLNNDEKKEPNISRASWLATIKVYFLRMFLVYEICRTNIQYKQIFPDMLNAEKLQSHFQWRKYAFNTTCIYVYLITDTLYIIHHKQAYSMSIWNNVKNKLKSENKVMYAHNWPENRSR